MQLTRAASGINALISCSGELREQKLTTLPLDGSWSRVTLEIPCEGQPISALDFEWRGLDTDADGNADAIEGKGSGRQLLHFDEQNSIYRDVSLELKALVDSTRATLQVPTSQHPLDSISVRASEALTPDSRVTLRQNDLSVPLTGYNANSSTKVFTAFAAATVLPFGTRWNVFGFGHDLGGLPFDTREPSVVVVEDPGVFPEDGFESIALASNPPIRLNEKVRFVDHVGTLPAIAGRWSLLVAPGGEATLHLRRPSCHNTLGFIARSLRQGAGYRPTHRIEAGVVGASERVSFFVQAPEVATSSATNDGEWPIASKVQTFEAPVTARGGDVVVRVSVDDRDSCPSGLQCEPFAVLLDDIRLE